MSTYYKTSITYHRGNLAVRCMFRIANVFYLVERLDHARDSYVTMESVASVLLSSSDSVSTKIQLLCLTSAR